jgi:hypothetical protein
VEVNAAGSEVLRIPRGDEALVKERQKVVVGEDHRSGGVDVLCLGSVSNTAVGGEARPVVTQAQRCVNPEYLASIP